MSLNNTSSELDGHTTNPQAEHANAFLVTQTIVDKKQGSLSRKFFITIYLKNKLLIYVLVLFFSIATGMVWHTKTLQESVVDVSAVQNAKIISEVLTEFRSLYTSEVITVAQRYGLDVTHDYINKQAIPLPATLSMLLGDKIGEKAPGLSTYLFSPYPFPWRKKTGGLSDDFRKAAWEILSINPDKPFFIYENRNGKKLLRYATADLMRESCVVCHNNHEQTPYNNWKTGDLRGVLEIQLPLDNIISRTQENLQITFLIYLILSVLGIVGIMIMINKHREHLRELGELSMTDPLTGLYNQRKLMEALRNELSKVKRGMQTVTLVYFDVDKFKKINDTQGHIQGDKILKYIGFILSRIIREIDIPCRYGGDEFCLILPGCDVKSAEDVCVRLIHQFQNKYKNITLSIGIAESHPDNFIDEENLIRAADMKMYEAKKDTIQKIKT
jgi:diguanylate cyclase (GGDEF)-like protein